MIIAMNRVIDSRVGKWRSIQALLCLEIGQFILLSTCKVYLFIVVVVDLKYTVSLFPDMIVYDVELVYVEYYKEFNRWVNRYMYC